MLIKESTGSRLAVAKRMLFGFILVLFCKSQCTWSPLCDSL